MDDMSSSLPAIETALSSGIRIIGGIIEILGVLVIVSGIAWSTIPFVRRQQRETHYDSYKIRIGRSLLLGLEVLVAADIVKTIALQLTFVSLGLLAGLVLVRTFLSWTLVLEIEGCWPWRRERPGTAPHAIMNDVVWRDIETNQSQAVGMRMRPSND